MSLSFLQGMAQNNNREKQNINSLAISSNTQVMNDSIANDTISNNISKDALKAKVEYQATDSISFDIQNRKIFLYSKGEINYEKINLTADRIDISFPNNLIKAFGTKDSTNKLIGNPIFTESGKEFKAKKIDYNYETKKGRIKNVMTQEGEGYMHGSIIKKLPDNSINVRKGSYTTCNLEHPHFELRYTKAKVIPNDKIVTGPAYLVIEDVPIPLFLPFGFFPNKRGQQSGILIPSYGESNNRGFFFENGGYYIGISEHADFEIRGDIYTRGSWALKPKFNYKKRYKYSGNFSGGYAVNIIGEKDASDYEKSTDFSIKWSHRQDPKARPNSQFNANVNIVTSNYNKNNPVSAQSYLSNTFSSSISYQTNFNNKIFLTASANHSQNTLNKTVNITLPQISVSANRMYPFKRKHRTGKQKWYENITVGYSMDTKNSISTYDTLLTFDKEMFDRFKNGMKHSIPINSSIKVLKYFNLSNTINFTERWYSRSISNQFIDEIIYSDNDTLQGYVQSDTTNGFYALHEYSFSSSLNTRIYGMVNFKKGPVKALRHVMSPSLSFSYHPDFGKEEWGYYDSYYNKNTERDVFYSYYNDGIYGKPASGKSGSINFSLGNNLEMKVKSKSDTTSNYKKIKLIESLSFRMSYNLAADSLNLSRLSVSGRTKLFKKLNITYSSSYDPYVINDNGVRINQFLWKTKGKLLRRDNTSWNFGLNLAFSDKDYDKLFESDKGTEAELQQINDNPDDYINWDNAWRVSLDYTLRYTNNYEKMMDKYNRDVIQTLGFSGSINVTEKWKVALRSGYDFKNKDFSYTSVNIDRNLHCWSMHFNWIPLGYRKSWNFTIQANSSLLQDLKLEKKKDFRDY